MTESVISDNSIGFLGRAQKLKASERVNSRVQYSRFGIFAGPRRTSKFFHPKNSERARRMGNCFSRSVRNSNVSNDESFLIFLKIATGPSNRKHSEYVRTEKSRFKTNPDAGPTPCVRPVLRATTHLRPKTLFGPRRLEPTPFSPFHPRVFFFFSKLLNAFSRCTNVSISIIIIL